LVIDDHRRVEPANLRLRAVELIHARLPFIVVDRFGGGARFPQIDAAGDTVENRPPLSHWHPDYANAFAASAEKEN
jgi:hypothetical protein